MPLPRRVIFAAVVVSSVAGGCNRRVFLEVPGSCDISIDYDADIPVSRAADILIVVDNSLSMTEEQQRLADNFFNLNIAADPLHPDVAAGECPLGDLANILPTYKNPGPDLYEGDGPLSRCGFIQLLAAFDNDFRVGVITTDMSNTDNHTGTAPADWGFRPQRGCLHGDGVHKLISRADLLDDDDTNDALADRFAETLAGISVYGSPYERGLDAMATFLDPNASRAAGCDDDLAAFRRPDAQLDVVFLSDENDCSHALGDSTFPDELAGEPQSGIFATPTTSTPDDCYRLGDTLSPVAKYQDALKAVDPGAKVVVIAGLLPDAADPTGFTGGGCLAGSPPSDQCFASHGNSNATQPAGNGQPAQVCAPESEAAHGGVPCCVADTGSRYLDFARGFSTSAGKDFFVDSICDTQFRDTMLQVAAFFGSTRFVDLAEAPAHGIAFVQLTRDGTRVSIDEISADECATKPGWYLEGDRRIVFCNDAIPAPGDELSVRAAGAVESETCQEP